MIGGTFHRCSLIALGLALPQMSAASVITPGNLLISSREVLYEYTTAGVQVQSFDVPYPGWPPVIESARDIVQAESGDVYVYNGTFDPYLSSLDPGSESWNHRTFSGWSTVNNGTYGGIAVTDNHAFVTDMGTFGDGGADNAQGVVRFDLDGANPLRFATDVEPIDLTLGLDGLLYVLHPGGSPGGRFVEVFDPATLAFIKQINLAGIFGHTEHRAIAVDSHGDLFIADLDGEVHHVSATGVLLDTINPECDWIGRPIHCQFYDIDISHSGMLALGTRFGEVFLTDTRFSSVSTFDVGRRGVFVAFSIPEPNTPPDCSGAVADPNLLWPPDQKFVDVAIVGVTDPDGDPVTITITDIAQDEPLEGLGDGNTCPDAIGVDTDIAYVRAERSGAKNTSGDGRVYHLSFTADDGQGGECSATVTVCVPHDQHQGNACVDQGPVFDSTVCGE